QHPIATSTHAVLDHARFFLFRLLRLAAAAHHGACPSAAGCPARAAEDGSDQAAVNGAAGGTFGRIAAGAHLAGNGPALGQIMFILRLVHALGIDHDALAGSTAGKNKRQHKGRAKKITHTRLAVLYFMKLHALSHSEQARILAPPYTAGLTQRMAILCSGW